MTSALLRDFAALLGAAAMLAAFGVQAWFVLARAGADEVVREDDDEAVAGPAHRRFTVAARSRAGRRRPVCSARPMRPAATGARGTRPSC